MKGQVFVREIQSQHATVVTSQLRTSGRRQLVATYQAGSVTVEGEASPLPGFGKDTLELARQSLLLLQGQQVEAGAQLLVEWAEKEGDCGTSQVWETLGQVFYSPSPSARFCWEMLCCRLAAHILGSSVFRLLNRAPKLAQLRTSQVLDPLACDLLVRAEQYFSEGVSTFKLKCGRSPKEEVEAARQLRSRFGPSLRLRLDANRALDIKVATQIQADLWHVGLEWLEDPTENPADWGSLHGTGVMLAVDELLVHQGINAAEYADVLILKPMALGGYAECFKLAEWAAKCGRQVCVSHLFDGPLSFEATCALAFCIQTADRAVGLSRHAGLSWPESPNFSWLFPDRMIVPINP